MAIKAGDTVRVRDTVQNRSESALLPLIGTLQVLTSANGLFGGNDRMGNGWSLSRFEKYEGNVRFKPQTAPKEVNLNPGDHIVMLLQGGKYLPSEEPKVYSSERQAMHVAKAMSKKHGGKFVAFRAIGEAELPTIEPTVRRYA